MKNFHLNPPINLLFVVFFYPEIIQLKSDFAYVMFYLLEEGTLFSLQGLLWLSKCQ